jgi:hypothetical protein
LTVEVDDKLFGLESFEISHGGVLLDELLELLLDLELFRFDLLPEGFLFALF